MKRTYFVTAIDAVFYLEMDAVMDAVHKSKPRFGRNVCVE